MAQIGRAAGSERCHRQTVGHRHRQNRHRLGSHACAPARLSPAGLHGGSRSQARPTADHRHRQTAGHRLTHAHTHTRSRQRHSAGHRHGQTNSRPPTCTHAPDTQDAQQAAGHSHQPKPNARPREETTAPALIPPSLCPSPNRRRVLLAAGGSFAGSRAQKFFRYDAKIAFPAARAKK